MRARDRRSPLAALVLLLGYILLGLSLFLAVANAFGLSEPIPLGPVLKGLLLANLGFFFWRVGWRFAFTARNYGWVEGTRAVLRIPVTNIITIMAGRRALTAYWRTLIGQRIVWDKTQHSSHPARFEPSTRTGQAVRT